MRIYSKRRIFGPENMEMGVCLIEEQLANWNGETSQRGSLEESTL